MNIYSSMRLSRVKERGCYVVVIGVGLLLMGCTTPKFEAYRPAGPEDQMAVLVDVNNGVYFGAIDGQPPRAAGRSPYGYYYLLAGPHSVECGFSQTWASPALTPGVPSQISTMHIFSTNYPVCSFVAKAGYRYCILNKTTSRVANVWNPVVEERPCSFLEAVEFGNLKLAQAMLKDNPGLVSSKGAGGNSPLHAAVWGGGTAVMEWLLVNNADVNAKDGIGRTPLNIAVALHKKAEARLLRQHGGLK
jgi:hypothetical protein